MMEKRKLCIGDTPTIQWRVKLIKGDSCEAKEISDFNFACGPN